MMMQPYFLPKRQKRKLIEDRIRNRDETNRLKRVLVLQRRTRVSRYVSSNDPTMPSIDRFNYAVSSSCYLHTIDHRRHHRAVQEHVCQQDHATVQEESR